MPDDTTEAREVLARQGDEVFAANVLRSEQFVFMGFSGQTVIRAMLDYADAARQTAIEDAARVCDDFAVDQRGRKIGPGGGVLDGTLENEAFVADHLAAAIRQLGFSGEKAK